MSSYYFCFFFFLVSLVTQIFCCSGMCAHKNLPLLKVSNCSADFIFENKQAPVDLKMPVFTEEYSQTRHKQECHLEATVSKHFLTHVTIYLQIQFSFMFCFVMVVFFFLTIYHCIYKHYEECTYMHTYMNLHDGSVRLLFFLQYFFFLSVKVKK